MNVIVCLDNSDGMAFNNRRQSMDRILRERLLSVCRGSRLLMDAYSCSQFENSEAITPDENFLENAGENDYCFVERHSFLPDKVKKLIVFRWNRDYPADLKLGFDIASSGFRLVQMCEFAGYSHEKITMEVYEK